MLRRCSRPAAAALARRCPRSSVSVSSDAGGAAVADFRSDTVTVPGPAMRRAMAEAAVGDDVYGEDPTVNRLESLVADLLGKEAALLVSSGTMGNLVSIGAVCGRGDELLVADQSHINMYEAGGASALLGAKITPLPTGYGAGAAYNAAASSPIPGVILPEQVAAACHGITDVHYAPTRMLCLENTNVTAGGSVLSLDTMKGLQDAAHRLGLHVHLDGARLFNASTALGCPVADVAAQVDSGTFCLSKGLGAPVGSMVFGSRDFVARARYLRKMVGGGMRQAGVVAAAGLHALEHNVAPLAQDHANARDLAARLQGVRGIEVLNPQVESNIVYARVSGDSNWASREGQQGGLLPGGGSGGDGSGDAAVEAEAAALVAGLGEAGFRVGSGYSDGGLRFVTHHDVTAADVARLAESIDRILNE